MSDFPPPRFSPPAPQRDFFDRRRKADWVTRAIQIFGGVGWLLAFGTLVFISLAKPRTEDFFTHLFNAPVNEVWDARLLRYSFFLFVIIFLVCVIGMLFNMRRHRRKSDKYNKSIITLGLLSFCGIIYFFLSFSSIFR